MAKRKVTRRPWTSEELLQLRDTSKSHARMGAILDRTASAVQSKRSQLGIKISEYVAGVDEPSPNGDPAESARRGIQELITYYQGQCDELTRQMQELEDERDEYEQKIYELDELLNKL